MQDCVTCQSPSKVKGYPQKREDFTERWIDLPNTPPWLKLKGDARLLVCQDCQQIWFLNYQARELYFDVQPLPDSLHELFQPEAPAEAFIRAFKDLPKPGRWQSFLFQISKFYFRQPPLQTKAELLFKALQDTQLSTESLIQLVSMLDTVVFAAIDTAFPEDLSLGSATRETLVKKLRENLHDSENIVEAAQKAHAQWAQERPVQYLPPLCQLKIMPLLDCLERVPAGTELSKYHEVHTCVTLRDKIRELLIQLYRQSQRTPPIVTLEAQSKQALAAYNGLAGLTQTGTSRSERTSSTLASMGCAGTG